jgi:hypothetical protein
MNQDLISGAILVGLGSFLITYGKETISNAITKIKSLCVYSVYFDQNEILYNVFSDWFAEKYPNKFKNLEAQIVENKSSFKLKFKQLFDDNIIRYDKKFLLVNKGRMKLEYTNNTLNVYLHSYIIKGFFAKKKIENLCKELLKQHIESTEKYDLVVKYNGDWGDYYTRYYETIKGFDNLFFKDKNLLINDLKTYKEGKHKYNNLGINFKRGYLLYGPPGTGKSSAAMAIAQYLKRSLYSINLASIRDDQAFQKLIANIPNGSCVLFEDIDGFIENRETRDSVNFNFSTLLNVLDGLYAPPDAVFIITTNLPNLLDNAIMRKGRMDFAIELGQARNKDIQDFLNHYYKTNIILCDPMKISKISMVDVQNLCLSYDNIEDVLEKIK